MTRFEQTYGRPADVVASAPGRVNLIGEHTDYNGGFVLPIALPQRTEAFLARRRDSTVRVSSVEVDGGSVEAYELGEEAAGRGWFDYVQGVTRIAALAGYQFSGFDLLVSSNVCIGKGLSSSASLEVAVVRALDLAYDWALDALTRAKIAHRAETEFVGIPVGVMDQMAASLADQAGALFIDTETLAFERVPLPGDVELAVIDSGIAHHHGTGEYRIRRRECEQAASLLGVERLRQLSAHDWPRLHTLPDPLNRRARHVVTENARVLQTVAAFQRGDAAAAGELFLDSHRSMRDDFEISLPEIDQLVAIAAADRDTFGARLTGGGFGGAIVALCRKSHAARSARAISEEYRALTKHDGRVLLPL